MDKAKAPHLVQVRGFDFLPTRAMTERRLAFLVLLLVTAAVVIPFTALSSVESIWGAFLFWILFALLVIALIIRATAGWKAIR